MKKLLLFAAFIPFVGCSVDNDELEEFKGLDAAVTSCTVNAGADNSVAYTNQYIDETVNDIGQIRGIYLNLLDEGVPTNGTFSPNMQQILRAYNKNNIGDFTTTYTVGEGECTDSTQLTVTICESIPSAGADNSTTYSKEYIDAQITDIGQITNLYLDLLDEGTARDGVFSPSINAIYQSFKSNPYQTFTTTYTLGQGKCIDSAELSITIVEEGPEPCSISAGADNSVTYTYAYVDSKVDDIGQIPALYFELLEDGVPTDGTFSPTIRAIFDQFRKNPYQTFSTVYTVGEGDCKDSVNLSITVTK